MTKLHFRKAGMVKEALVSFFLVLAATSPLSAEDGSRLYGRIWTTDGEKFDGYIQWDKNEVNWVDILNGTKQIPADRHKSSRKNRSDKYSFIRFPGFDVFSSDHGKSSTSGIRMGHIQSLVPTGRNSALLILKSGAEIKFRGGATDIGTSNRGITVESDKNGELTLEWREIEKVEFMPSPETPDSRQAQRIHGTLTTRDGNTFKGYVCWDIDEVFERDILDGNNGRRRMKIKFGNIAYIERIGSRATFVRLKSGREYKLSGTNDVNSGNRGILISDPGFGQVEVAWRNFKNLTFNEDYPAITYADFDGGRRLSGTVYTEDNEEFSGMIHWDKDEAYTWEFLNGWHDDGKLAIEFGLIQEINKVSSRTSNVHLRDGRHFQLRGSNDVNRENRGIVVEQNDGNVIIIDWSEFQRVEFAKSP